MSKYILAGVLAFILLNIAAYLAITLYAGHRIYTSVLKRRSKEEWGRAAPTEFEFQMQMDREGMQWQSLHDAYKKEVHIVRDGLNLYGEYYDMGHDKAVMILSGRTESLRYGYYFAQPYAAHGMNVLVVDPRAHGLSDGQYNTVGFEESKDALAWVQFLHETYGVQSVVFHGICIGAAGGMLAITSDQCPEYISGLVTEGMFARFCYSMENNLIERKRNLPLLVQTIDFWMKHYTGHSMMKGPVDVISKMDKPLLMLHSREDLFSKPDKAQLLYDLCPSARKRIVWFEKGAHSRLRYTDKARYDTAIHAFLDDLYGTAGAN